MSLSARLSALLLSASALLITACNDPKEIGLPQGQSLGVFFKDNFTIRASTVLVDSVLTSGSSYLLAGKATDPQTGVITAESYFQPVYTTNEPPTFAADAIVESLEMVLPYDFVYGDASVEQHVSVHLLDGSIERRPHYSYEKLPYSSGSVGSTVYTPMPDSAADKRVVRIRLNETVVNTLLSLSGRSFEEFVSAFKGFALVYTGSPAGAVVAYRATTERVQGATIRMVYREGAAEKTYTYSIFNGAGFQPYLFNHITENRTGTALATLRNRYDSLQATAQSGHAAFVQGGTGIMTRLEISNLGELRQLGNIAINKAELIVHQLGAGRLPATPGLMLYEATAQGNILRDTLYTAPYLLYGVDFRNPLPLAPLRESTYTMDVTVYINQLVRAGVNAKKLYLSLPSTFTDEQFILRRLGAETNAPVISSNRSLEESVGRIMLGGPQHPTLPMKLRVYYTPVNPN